MNQCYYSKCKKSIIDNQTHIKVSIINGVKVSGSEIYCDPNCAVNDLLVNGYGSPRIIQGVFSDILADSIEHAIAKSVIPKENRPSP